MAELWDIVDEHGNPTGRFHERGVPMKPGDYHPSVIVWIVNGRGEFLITQRSPEKRAGGMWETTAGCAVAGEDSLTAALREVREEVGLRLDPADGVVYKEYPYPHVSGDGAAYNTVWVFRTEYDTADVVLQPGETCGFRKADAETVLRMMREGEFIPYDFFGDLCEAFGLRN